MTSQSVTIVIATMNVSVILDTSRLRIANRINTPRLNSMADNPTEEANVIQSGTIPWHDNASK